MQDHLFSFADQTLTARATGTLWWESEKLLCVSDMHLGKSERIARKHGGLLPPFETQDTLARLGDDILTLNPKTVICLGDSFDDLECLDSLNTANHKRLCALTAGRTWIWIEGNHDAGPVDLGGTHMKHYMRHGIVFRHIAEKTGLPEISGHFHPKARIPTAARGISRKCFLTDKNKIIMPAFGTYTGGLSANHDALSTMMQPDAIAILTGQKAVPFPMQNT